MDGACVLSSFSGDHWLLEVRPDVDYELSFSLSSIDFARVLRVSHLITSCPWVMIYRDFTFVKVKVLR